MVLRKCNICDRRFKKTEHYKRHERSHTKERPYECSVCHKRFSRSDVLSRHAKGHLQKQEKEAAAKANSAANKDAVNPSSDSANMNATAGSQMMPPDGDERPVQMSANSNSTPAAQLANIPPTPRDMHMAPPGGLSNNLDFLANISTHQARTEPELNPMMIDDHPQYFNWNDPSATLNAPVSRPVGFEPVPNEMLQLWLEPRADSSVSHPSSLEMMREAKWGVMGDQFVSTERRASTRSHETSKNSDTIPSERFIRVQRCWLAPPNVVGRLMHSLWRDVSCYEADNLFTVPAYQGVSIADNQPGTRFGLDEECRQQLQAAFGLTPQSLANLNSNSSNEGLSPGGSSGSGSCPNFPPAEVLDMALDLYFRHFHPLVPFVHMPTFVAKRTRLPLLFVMCQIGMIILGTKGTTNFVLKTFNCVLEKVSSELAKCSVGNGTPVGILSTMATAFLMLNLAAMTGDKEHLQQSQMLYVSLMAVAQRHGLFSAGEGQPLDMALLESIPDLDMRWKAWSRVESTKRLIVGLLLVDSWFSSFFSTSPVIVPDSVQVILPCSDALFRANTSGRWMQLIRSGKQILMPIVRSPSETVPLPNLEEPVDDLTMHGVLAMLQLRMSEAYHRLLANRASYPFAPCHTYAMDARTRCLTSLQVQVVNTYGDLLRVLSPNCVVMWHHMCMNLTADIQIFDLAAGRNGVGPARDALDDIAAWSQTPAARRACLHAAQIFKALTNRKASDDIMFHSVSALFSAALVLGLYTFMVPQSAETQAGATSIELLDDIDWRVVGNEGFSATPNFMENNGPVATPAASQDRSPGMDLDPAVRFIRHGGTIYIRGVPHQGGYQSARRVLLDFGGLLKDTGKWSVRKFSYVLHIMSDVIMEVD